MGISLRKIKSCEALHALRDSVGTFVTNPNLEYYQNTKVSASIPHAVSTAFGSLNSAK
ncbi:MAG: hypothetical protein JHC93_05650 [Parachlamydiales bacterium]|nr:hypothetical protein [Parachlamydiales bacterium]